MRVALVGGTGVIGRSALASLRDAGHDLVAVVRSRHAAEQVERLGVAATVGDVYAPESLQVAFAAADAVVNLASSVPVGTSAFVPGAWRRDDRLRTAGVAHVVDAARRCGVRRVVQSSASFVYADQGADWITESSPVAITAMTEPTAVAESLVQDYAGGTRVGVLLRFGTIVGDDAQTRHLLRAAATGRSVTVGDPRSWTHLVHTDDLGPAVLAALHAPSGTFNVGADPVRREHVASAYAEAVEAPTVPGRGPISRRLLAGRSEPFARSLRVCSDHFTAQTGWRATRSHFDASWLDQTLARQLRDVGV